MEFGKKKLHPPSKEDINEMFTRDENVAEAVTDLMEIWKELKHHVLAISSVSPSMSIKQKMEEMYQGIHGKNLHFVNQNNS